MFEDLARTIAVEAAKPITAARAEVTRCISTFRFSAAVCRTTRVDPDARVCREEVFGPVVVVNTHHDLERAFAAANDTRYGLHAGIFTGSLATTKRALEVLDFGGVIVNDVPTWRADRMPYGGLRDSGNTREGPRYAAHEMTETRTIVIS